MSVWLPSTGPGLYKALGRFLENERMNEQMCWSEKQAGGRKCVPEEAVALLGLVVLGCPKGPAVWEEERRGQRGGEAGEAG